MSNADVSRITRWIKAQGTLKAHLVSVCRAEELSVGGVKADLQHRLESRLKLYLSENDQVGLAGLKMAVDNAGREVGMSRGNSNGGKGVMAPRTSLPASVNMMGNMGFHDPKPALEFKPSPFYRIQRQLGDMKTCEPILSNQRNTVTINVRASAYPELANVRDDPSLKVMVFACHEDYGRHDVTFPHQSGLSVNGNDLKVNLRGLKGKPGSTRPVDITNELRLNSTIYTNTISMTYAMTYRKYFVAVYLVKLNFATDLVKKLENGKRITRATVIAEMISKARDPDIQATSSILSLKCPLSTLRIDLPCRSIACRHNQCFDALSFLQLQEQGPTWSCPICSNAVPFESLVVDEYVRDIIKSTPKSVDQVTIEPDGKWSQHLRNGANGNSGASCGSDDEDDLVEITPVKSLATNQSIVARTPPGSSREASDSIPAPRSGNSKPPPAVIDLTLSDDDDEPIARAPKRQYSSLGAIPFNEPVERPSKRQYTGPGYSTPPSMPHSRS